MSLTSYRAAPPRGVVCPWRGVLAPWRCCRPVGHVMRLVLGWPGNDLLSRVLRHSTIGAEEFNGRVRDGIGFGLLAQVTGPAKDKGTGRSLQECWPGAAFWGAARDWAFRPDGPARFRGLANWSDQRASRTQGVRQGRRPPALMRRSCRRRCAGLCHDNPFHGHGS